MVGASLRYNQFGDHPVIVELAVKDNRVLLDLRKTRIVDVQSDKDTQDKPPVIYNYVDANTERNQARLEKRRSKSPQD